MTVDRLWLTATLTDTLESLKECIDRLEDERLDAEEILMEDLANVYAKLNYAVNTAEIGPEAIDEMDHDALISWPVVMPFDREESLEDNH